MSRKKSPVTNAFEENANLLKRFLARFFSEKQDVEDVAQEVFLRAYIAEQSKDIEQPKAYLFRIAKNLAMTRLAKKTRQIAYLISIADEAENTPEVAFSADDEVEALENLGAYCKAVAALPVKCRQVYLLRKVHGFSHQEIAERMSLSVSSVEKYLLKGILECKSYLEQNGQPLVSETRNAPNGSTTKIRRGRQ